MNYSENKLMIVFCCILTTIGIFALPLVYTAYLIDTLLSKLKGS